MSARPSPAPDLTISPMTPDLVPALGALFDQGGDPKWCWCAYFRVRGLAWTNSTPELNRAVLEAATAQGTETGRAPGLVAFDGDEAVGWVSFAPRAELERLAHSRLLAPVDERPVWSIVCFVVGRRSRGRGIADALLAAAVAYAREHGATMLEAYPIDPGAGRVPSANAYHGTLRMFLRAGFSVVAERKGSATATARPIVRLELA